MKQCIVQLLVTVMFVPYNAHVDVTVHNRTCVDSAFLIIMTHITP